jgi:uncharacterized protein (TIGR02271 family)
MDAGAQSTLLGGIENMARSIAGLFEDRTQAEQAVEDLKAAGFSQDRIGIVMQDKQQTRAVNEAHGTHSTESAIGGSLIGGTAGALLAATGALVIPGIGPFISGGILATSLVGGAAGWLVGGLTGLGIPKEEAEYYEGRVQQGAALVTVDAAGRDAEARQILLRDGAEDLQSRGFGGGYDTTAATTGATIIGATEMAQPIQSATAQTYQQPMQPMQPAQSSTVQTAQTTNANDVRVPVYEEELVASKRAEEVGHVHLHKEVTTEQASIPVTLEREQVTVERVPVNQTVDLSGAQGAFQGTDIDVPVMGEEAVVGKTTREVEEVRLRKQEVTEQQQVSDTVRRERVVVDRDGVDQTGSGTTSSTIQNSGTTLNDTTR